MRGLKQYIIEESESVEEGLIRNSISIALVKSIPVEDLMNGILSMYEYICDNKDIKLFYKDMPMKQRPLWKSLYDMYKQKLWSIYDISQSTYKQYSRNKIGNRRAYDDDEYEDEIFESSADNIEEYFEKNKLCEVNVKSRRLIRNIMKKSRNRDSELDVSLIQEAVLIDDPLFPDRYLITLNKVTGVMRRLFKSVDVICLKSIFEKIIKKLEE